MEEALKITGTLIAIVVLVALLFRKKIKVKWSAWGAGGEVEAENFDTPRNDQITESGVSQKQFVEDKSVSVGGSVSNSTVVTGSSNSISGTQTQER